MLKIFDQLDSLIIIGADVRKAPLFLNRTALVILGLKAGEEIDYNNPPPLLSLMWNLFSASGYGVHDIHEPQADHWFRILITPLEWLNGEMVYLYYCNDITEHKNIESTLAKAASTDPLTGLLNRRGYAMASSREWGHCQRYNRPISLLMIDIDHFKRYNDSYGHLQGDQCLMALAECLRGNVNRMTDVVARVGGEEFVVLLPYADVNGGKVMAEKLGKAAEQVMIPRDAARSADDGYQRITISIGLASTVPSPDSQLETLFLQADQALYAAKRSGRNRYCVYDQLPEAPPDSE
jgi:diguanylate cyclase (GGDEF)-like protein